VNHDLGEGWIRERAPLKTPEDPHEETVDEEDAITPPANLPKLPQPTLKALEKDLLARADGAGGSGDEDGVGGRAEVTFAEPPTSAGYFSTYPFFVFSATSLSYSFFAFSSESYSFIDVWPSVPILP
jgi:hypothetical protein